MHNSIPEKAKRSDKIKPMPLESESLTVEWVYTLEEFGRITNGFIPESMDDKWFIFYEAPFLYLHRSWTGFCIYVVRFEPSTEGIRIAEVIVNRNPNQYGQISFLCGDDSKSLALLRKLLDSITQPDIARQKRKQASQEREIQSVIAVAEKMLSGEMGIIEGSRKLVALGRNTRLHDAEKFLIFRGIDSEADVLPTSQSREYWNPEVLKRKDQESADYEARVRDAALQACRDLLDTYKSGG